MLLRPSIKLKRRLSTGTCFFLFQLFQFCLNFPIVSIFYIEQWRLAAKTRKTRKIVKRLTYFVWRIQFGLEFSKKTLEKIQITQIYLKISAIQRGQAISTLAQNKGLFAAKALNMKTCTRINGSGNTLFLEQCTKFTI